MSFRSLDAIVAGLFFLFGLWLFYMAWGYGITSQTGPGSGTFPAIAAVLVTVFSAMNFARYFSGMESPDVQIAAREVIQIVATILLVLVFVKLAGVLGMFIPLPFLVVAVSLCVHWRTDLRWLVSIALGSVLFSLLCFLIFEKALGILLPVGPFGF